MVLVKPASSTIEPTLPEEDVYTVLGPTTWICGVVGIFPLTLRGFVGQRKYSLSYVTMIYSLALLALAITSLCIWTENTFQRLRGLSFHAVVQVSTDIEKMIAVSSMTAMVLGVILGKDKFEDAIDILNSQDIALQKLGTEPKHAADFKRNCIRMGTIMSIITISCIFDFIYQLDFNMRFPIDWLAWMWPNIVRIMSICLFVNVIIILKNRFSVLNQDLKSLISKTKHSSLATISTPERICERIRSIAMIHGYLCEVALKVNQMFNFNIIIGVIYALTIQTTSFYYIIEELTNSDVKYDYIFGFLNWSALGSIPIIYLVSACHITQTEASLTGKLIHKFQISDVDTPLNDVIQSFSLQLHHEGIQFSGAGLFPLDATLIQSIVGAVTTYLVILIQFDTSVSNIMIQNQTIESMT